MGQIYTAAPARRRRSVVRVFGTLRETIYFGVEYRLLVTSRDGTNVQVRSRDMTAIEALSPGTAVELS